jgi:hypothetical protein
MLMDKIANPLDPGPTRSHRSKFLTGKSHELAINFAITAGQEKGQCGRRHLAHKCFFRLRSEKIRFATVPDYGKIAKMDCAGGGVQPSAMIAKRIVIVLDRQIGLYSEILSRLQSGLTRGMNS